MSSSLVICRHAAIVTVRRVAALPSRRAYASKAPETGPSHTDFYKTFGRPIAKVLMIAMFTYQVLYIGWTKMEQNEVRAERNSQVLELEKKVMELRADKK